MYSQQGALEGETHTEEVPRIRFVSIDVKCTRYKGCVATKVGMQKLIIKF